MRILRRTAIAVAVFAVAVFAVAVLAAVVILGAGRDADSVADMIDVMTATIETDTRVTCIYRGAPGSSKKVGCASGKAYRYSDYCNSDIYGTADFLQLTEGNPPADAVAARARPDRWNIRDNYSPGRPLLGYIVRTAGSDWTLYGPKGRRIGHIVGAYAVEAALVYLGFGDFECVGQ
jgi:hypothetical protein